MITLVPSKEWTYNNAANQIGYYAKTILAALRKA
jgi:hypothetical protein